MDRYARTAPRARFATAGAGTIFRNYLLPLAGGVGQTATRQVDCLAALGDALGNQQGELWTMRNGYALATPEGLRRIDAALQARSASELDALRDLLEVGVQWDVQVTEPGAQHPLTQVYCSALPVAYCDAPPELWAGFATLVLEAAYEATLLAGVLNQASTGNPTVYLTRLGGGAFGNETAGSTQRCRKMEAGGRLRDSGAGGELWRTGSPPQGACCASLGDDPGRGPKNPRLAKVASTASSSAVCGSWPRTARSRALSMRIGVRHR